MTKIKAITADELRSRVAGAYKNMADLSSSMRDMAYLAGILSTCDAVAAVGEAARFDKLDELGMPKPAAPIDHHTVQYLLDCLRKYAAETAEGIVVMEQIDPNTVQTRGGRKPN